MNTTTWDSTTKLTANVDIIAGATVTIAAGATIDVSSGVTITVHGTLTASDKASHAKLTNATSWGGIVVASGGTMNLVGVDLENATSGIHVFANDAAAEYDYGVLTGGMFTVDTNGTFKTDHVTVVKGGSSMVNGTFTATYLDWAASSLSMGDATASVFVGDTKITGVGGDFFTPSAGKLLHIEYSTIDGTHCPVHFSGVTKFELDHITTGGTGATSNSGWGLMLYNADPGPHSIKNSNFNDPYWDQTQHGVTIDVDHTWIKSIGPQPAVGAIVVTNKQTSAAGNPDAKPRGAPGSM